MNNSELKQQIKTLRISIIMLCVFSMALLGWIVFNSININSLRNSVTVEEYNKLVDNINDKQVEINALKEQTYKLEQEIEQIKKSEEAYGDAIIRNNATLIAQYVNSQQELNEDLSVEFVENEKTTDFKVLTDGIIETDGYIEEEYFNEVVENYNKIPEEVRQSLEEDGWKIEITSDDLVSEGLDGKILAITFYQEKKICVSQYDAESIIHEVGHYLDYKNDFASDNFDMDVYAEEINGFMLMNDTAMHNLSTMSEYVAESFAMYVLDSDSFRTNCPETFEYIEQSINN